VKNKRGPPGKMNESKLLACVHEPELVLDLGDEVEREGNGQVKVNAALQCAGVSLSISNGHSVGSLISFFLATCCLWCLACSHDARLIQHSARVCTKLPQSCKLNECGSLEM
jgi:hypothetical protein